LINQQSISLTSTYPLLIWALEANAACEALTEKEESVESYEEWAGFLGNKTMVEALLSRVRHYRHTVRIEGPSLREPQG
jgi:IstB-like ATP binding protein